MSFPSAGRRVRSLVVTALVERARSGRRAGCARRRRRHRAACTSCRARTRTSTPSRATPSAAQQQWMRDHYARMRPGRRTSTRGWTGTRTPGPTSDAYAIYRESDPSDRAPRVDPAGRRRPKLYIPFGCGGGSCPQFAADIGNPAFRAPWIADARATLAAGYQGLFIDDVNMAAADLRRQRQPARSRRPAHRRPDERGLLAALHGRLHGADPRRESRTPRSSTTLSGSRRRARHPPPAHAPPT